MTLFDMLIINAIGNKYKNGMFNKCFCKVYVSEFQ